ncbi:MAG: GAF domain-containing protein [Chitinophagaceae bacterium]
MIQLNRLYAFISQLNQTIVHAQDVPEVFKEVCNIAVETGKFKAAWISLFDLDNQSMEFIEGSGVLASDVSELGDMRMVDDSLYNRVLQTGGYHFCNDIASDPALKNWQPFADKRNFGSS